MHLWGRPGNSDGAERFGRRPECYLGKISGPLLDRIDLHVEVPAVPYKEMRADEQGVSSAEMRARIEGTRRIQQQRGHYNSQLPTKLLRKLCRLDDAGERTLEMAMRRLALSARAHSPLSKSPAPSPTSTSPKPSPPSTWPKRCNIGVWIGVTRADGKHHDRPVWPSPSASTRRHPQSRPENAGL